MRKWSPLIAVSVGTFMLLVDVTIVTVALPAIATELKTSLGGLQWVLLIGAGDLLQSRLTATSPATALIPGLIVVGLGVAAVLPTLASAALSSVPHERSGMAGGAVNTFRQLGFALGVAVFGAIFTGRLAGRADARAAAADAVGHTLLAAGILALAAGVLVLLLVRATTPQWAAPSPAADPEPVTT